MKKTNWSNFPRSYSSGVAYWYQPKGLAITAPAVKDRLNILSEFSGLSWRDHQSSYVSRLREVGLSAAEPQWESGGAPLARMLKQVFITLGLAWVDDQDMIEISPAGQSFIESNDPDEILSLQALRYQFWNPSIGVQSRHGSIRLHPVPFLVRLLIPLGNYISNDEYILFVARSENISDVDIVAEKISEFRELDKDQRFHIRDKCQEYMIGGNKISSIFNTIMLNRTYAFKMWSLSKLIYQKKTGYIFHRKILRDASEII